MDERGLGGRQRGLSDQLLVGKQLHVESGSNGVHGRNGLVDDTNSPFVELRGDGSIKEILDTGSIKSRMKLRIIKETEDLETNGGDTAKEINTSVDPIFDSMKSGVRLTSFGGVGIRHDGSNIDKHSVVVGLISTDKRVERGGIAWEIVPLAPFLDQFERKLSIRLLRHWLIDDVEDVFKRIIANKDNWECNIGVGRMPGSSRRQGVVLGILPD